MSIYNFHIKISRINKIIIKIISYNIIIVIVIDFSFVLSILMGSLFIISKIIPSLLSLDLSINLFPISSPAKYFSLFTTIIELKTPSRLFFQCIVIINNLICFINFIFDVRGYNLNFFF